MSPRPALLAQRSRHDRSLALACRAAAIPPGNLGIDGKKPGQEHQGGRPPQTATEYVLPPRQPTSGFIMTNLVCLDRKQRQRAIDP
jgi:hypothetical protein